jgi:hypothetical protein
LACRATADGVEVLACAARVDFPGMVGANSISMIRHPFCHRDYTRVHADDYKHNMWGK